MRSISDTLLTAQQAMTIDALVKIVLTRTGQTTRTYDRDRILDINHPEEPYSQRCELVLDNSAKALNDIDLKGYKAVISYGAIGSAGEEYSATAPLWVMSQQFESSPGKLDCTLSLVGIPNLMAEDKASASYMPDEDDTKSVKTLINEILGKTIACYSHCQAYEVVWEAGYDSLADTYKPKDSFRIYVGGSRLAAIRRLLDYTKNVMIAKADGKVHIFKPTISGVVYDYHYSLESGHTFFSKALRNRLVIPSRVVVKSQPDDTEQYEGEAVDTDSHALLPKTEFRMMRLESDSQAEDIAEAILSKAQMWAEAGALDVPLNVAQEVYDYIDVVDAREDDERVGNIGHITRHYNAEKAEWRMTFSFGNWMTVRKALANIGITEVDEIQQYFTKLMVKDLYVENILAENMNFVWIDPDNTIDLSKIGDNLDNLPDGETYARIKTLHLDAGQVKLDENILYTNNYDPTAKFDPSHDTLDDIPEGFIYQRAKSAALTADGLVILDQVVIGTYGLVKSAYISAGRILLDSVETGTYGLVKSTDISAGHIKLSSVVQTTSYRTTSDTEKTTWNGKEVAIHRGTTAPTDKTKLWVDTSATPNVWKRWTGSAWVKCTPTELDEIADGATYARVLKTDISAGHIRLAATLQDVNNRTTTDAEKSAWDNKPETMDEIDIGIYFGKLVSDQISTYGYIKLNSNSLKDGTWYNEGGVIIDASSGIEIFGSNMAFKTAAYQGGTPQCYMNSDGAICAGGGSVLLDAGGIRIVGSAPTLRIRYYSGTGLGSIYAANSTDLRIESTARITLQADTSLRFYANSGITFYDEIVCENITTDDINCYDIRPRLHETYNCGYSDEAWNQGVFQTLFSADGNVYQYQDHDDLAILKRLKTQINKKGRKSLDASSLPTELFEENKQGEKFINMGGLQGLSLGIMRQLLDRIELLEKKVGA